MYDPEAHKKGWTMISAPSLHLPHLAPKGMSSLNIQVNNSYHWQNGWATGTDDPFARTPQYRKLKKKVLDDIIREAEYIIPGLSERIVYKEMATPRSFSRWTLNPEGAIMGWTLDSLKCHMAKEYARFRTVFGRPTRTCSWRGNMRRGPQGSSFRPCPGGSCPRASMVGSGGSCSISRQTGNYGYVAGDPRHSVLFGAPSPICLGSVSPSPYKVARHKSPREPRTAPNSWSATGET